VAGSIQYTQAEIERMHMGLDSKGAGSRGKENEDE
jgi:hypothetical protein